MKKPKTQLEAIVILFKLGNTLDWIKAFNITGCSKLSTRVSDLQKLGYVFIKKKIDFITKYGTSGYYYEYKLDLKKTPKTLLKK